MLDDQARDVRFAGEGIARASREGFVGTVLHPLGAFAFGYGRFRETNDNRR